MGELNNDIVQRVSDMSRTKYEKGLRCVFLID